MPHKWSLIAALLAAFAVQSAHAQSAPDVSEQTQSALDVTEQAQSAPDVGEQTQRGDGWRYFRRGSPTDIKTPTTFGLLFEGGGTDVDAAYVWLCAHAGNGDILILRASGTPAYDPYIQRLCPGVNSVSTLVIFKRRAARDPFVLDAVNKAEAIFISGGNQANYVRFWQQTPLNHAIDVAARRGIPIGGTSAGNAVLAQFAYSALTRSVTSSEALADPFNFRITLSNGFLNVSPLLKNTITDDHFVTRNRMGRLVTFLARIGHDRFAPRPFAIATNEHTAFLMEADGKGRIVGSGAAYFVNAPGRPEICRPETPLTFRNVAVYKITKGGTFDIRDWTGTGGTAYSLSAVDGVLTSTQPGGGIY